MKKLLFYGMAFCLFLASCKKDDENTSLPFDINIANSATFGNYLVNKSGHALYMFANDADGLNSCAGICANLWPIANLDPSAIQLETGLTAADFANITLTDGRKQLTYKGWPLYTYAPGSTDANGNTVYTQEAPKLTSGEGVGNGNWFVAKTDYTISLANKQLTGANGINYKGDYTVGDVKTQYFVDSKGRTIYAFANDSFNINKYTRSDFSNNATWPLYEEDRIVVPSFLNKSLFGSILVFGRKQMTYKGWPLYYFIQDAARGQNKGVSVPVPGRWPVATKDMPEARR